jgi:hypothetical protein
MDVISTRGGSTCRQHRRTSRHSKTRCVAASSIAVRHAYLRDDFWGAFIGWENEARRAICKKRDFVPVKDYGVLAAAASEGRYEEDNNQDMDDETPPATVKLEALAPDDYDEDADTNAAMEVSKAEEEAKWSSHGLDEAVQLSAMVADHVASLPPPPLASHVLPPSQYVPPEVPCLGLPAVDASGVRRNSSPTMKKMTALGIRGFKLFSM